MADACAIEGCEARAATQGWCRGHFKRWRNHGDPLGGRIIPDPGMDLGQRLLMWSKQNGECLESTASKNSQGYAMIRVDKRSQYVHRLAYQLWVGPIPPKWTIDHLCRNPPCFRPEHLEAVPQSVNVLRATPFRERTAKQCANCGGEFYGIAISRFCKRQCKGLYFTHKERGVFMSASSAGKLTGERCSGSERVLTTGFSRGELVACIDCGRQLRVQVSPFGLHELRMPRHNTVSAREPKSGD